MMDETLQTGAVIGLTITVVVLTLIGILTLRWWLKRRETNQIVAYGTHQ